MRRIRRAVKLMQNMIHWGCSHDTFRSPTASVLFCPSATLWSMITHSDQILWHQHQQRACALSFEGCARPNGVASDLTWSHPMFCNLNHFLAFLPPDLALGLGAASSVGLFLLAALEFLSDPSLLRVGFHNCRINKSCTPDSKACWTGPYYDNS